MKRNRTLLPLILTCMLGLCATSAFAEEAKKDAKAAAHHKTLMETIIEGGWVMVPIGLMSMLTVYLAAEGLKKTTPKKSSPPKFEA